MVSMAIVKMSSKGQIVIPASMRSNFKIGDELFIIKDDSRIILNKAENLTKQMREDLEFARLTEEALQRIEAGNFISVDSENLVEEMSKW